MNLPIRRLLLFLSLLLAFGCGSGSPPPQSPGKNAVLFDPTGSVSAFVPLPNILVTAAAGDPLLNFSGSTLPRPAGRPMDPLEAMAYVNRYEMNGSNAVAGLNAPIYIRFTGAVDAATVTAANIKVFQLAADGTGPRAFENKPLGFSDVTGTFTFQYTAGSTDLFLFPNFPLQPASRYLYLVTSRVKDAATGEAVSGSVHFEALKSSEPLAGPFAGLEPIRANTVEGADIRLSGFAKVMDDLIAAAPATTVGSRSEIALLGRFITTAAGSILKDPADGASLVPVESALRSFAAGAGQGGLSGKSWASGITVSAILPPAAYWAGIAGAGSPPAGVGSVTLGRFSSAELSMDPVVVRANAATMELSAVSGAYNPAAGVVQPFRDGSGALTGYYHTDRSVPFVYLAPVLPNGRLAIFQHGITGQKEQVVAIAGALTAAGFAVVAIDLPLHGELALPGHTAGSVWGEDFMAAGAPLATRSNIQQAAFNLHRLELTIKAGALVAAGVTSTPPAETRFVGVSLGSIVGAYYLAGNTTLTATGPTPYSQATLNGDMKGFLSVPGGRTAYLIQNSPTLGPGVNAGLAARGIAAGSPAYHQFFQLTQSVVDPVDPATITTPLAAGLPSRLSGRIAIQEATSTTFDAAGTPTNGDLVITNPFTRYFGNALGGRGILGAGGDAVAPGFFQLGYTGAAFPRVPSPFMLTLTGGIPTPKVAFAAAVNTATAPVEGYFQFDQAGITHGFLLDPRSSAANTALAQKQLTGFLSQGIVADPTSPALPRVLAAVAAAAGDVQLPPALHLFGYWGSRPPAWPAKAGFRPRLCPGRLPAAPPAAPRMG